MSESDREKQGQQHNDRGDGQRTEGKMAIFTSLNHAWLTERYVSGSQIGDLCRPERSHVVNSGLEKDPLRSRKEEQRQYEASYDQLLGPQQ